MTNDNLAPVYLDNKPLTLSDPKPKLSAVLSALGKPATTDVKWLQFQPNSPGKSVRPEEVLDRTTDPSKPIYLTSAPKVAVVPPIANAPAGKDAVGKEAAGMIGSTAPAFQDKAARPWETKGKDAKADIAKAMPAAKTEDAEDESGMQHDAEAKGEATEGSTDDSDEKSGE